MATTFKISNGDVTLSKVTGQPFLIGNDVGASDKTQAKAKRSQDIQGSLSLNNLDNGASADLHNLIGEVPRLGSDVVGVLIKEQIINMFSNILSLQARRQGVRPNNELFSSISALQIISIDESSYQFKLSVVTVDGSTSTSSGVFNA